MSSNNSSKKCVFSAISGQITFDGKPAANARIKRIASKAFAREQIIDEIHTDEQGYFILPAVFDKPVLGKFLPMEFAVPQQIIVYHGSKKYEIWDGVKRDPSENSESSGHPLIVSCELTDPLSTVDVGGGFVTSMCKWKFEADPPFQFEPPIED